MIMIWQGSDVISNCVKSHMKLESPLYISCVAKMRLMVCMCGCFGNMCTCVYCVLYCLYCIFLLFILCIFILICFVRTSIRTIVTD